MNRKQTESITARDTYTASDDFYWTSGAPTESEWPDRRIVEADQAAVRATLRWARRRSAESHDALGAVTPDRGAG